MLGLAAVAGIVFGGAIVALYYDHVVIPERDHEREAEHAAEVIRRVAEVKALLRAEQEVRQALAAVKIAQIEKQGSDDKNADAVDVANRIIKGGS